MNTNLIEWGCIKYLIFKVIYGICGYCNEMGKGIDGCCVGWHFQLLCPIKLETKS